MRICLRRRAAMCAALAAMLPAAGALGVRDRAGRYVDPQHGYSFDPPAGWTRKTDMPKTFVAYLGPLDEGAQANFTIYAEPAANKSLAQYARVAKETIAKSGEMHLQAARRTKLGGAPAEVLQSRVAAKGHAPAISLQVLAVRAGTGYVLTFTSPPDPPKLKKYSAVLDRMLASFRWKR